MAHETTENKSYKPDYHGQHNDESSIPDVLAFSSDIAGHTLQQGQGSVGRRSSVLSKM